MAEFTLIISENDEADLIAANEDQKLEGMMADEVVMDWLEYLDSDGEFEESSSTRASYL